MNDYCLIANTSIGEFRKRIWTMSLACRTTGRRGGRLTGFLVVLTSLLLSPATAPAGTFNSVDLYLGVNTSNFIINPDNLPGSAVFGGWDGSGTGQSVRFSFTESHGGVSFSVAGHQDFGTFGGTAAVSQDQDTFGTGTSYRVDAVGISQEDWTINGGVGIGYLNLGWLVSGSTLTQASANAYADAWMTIHANSAYFPPRFGSGTNIGDLGTGVFRVGGFYPGMDAGATPHGLPFIFGTPFTITVMSQVHAEAAGPDNEAYIAGALADFFDTATLRSIGVTDVSGNPISNFQIMASSGTQYNADGVVLADAGAAVPEPSSMILWGIGALFLTIGSLRRRRRARVIGKRD